MEYQKGPVTVREPKYEAEILATDMRGNYPLLGRVRLRGSSDEWTVVRWGRGGTALIGGGAFDIVPRKLTEIELAKACSEEYDRELVKTMSCYDAMSAAINLLFDLIKRGRVECPCKKTGGVW